MTEEINQPVCRRQGDRKNLRAILSRFSVCSAAVVLLLAAVLSITGWADRCSAGQSEDNVSGEIVEGLRYLRVPSGAGQGAAPLALTVYRGDYVHFVVTEPVQLEIAELGIFQLLTPEGAVAGSDAAEKRYFKMKQSGSFALRLGDETGTITVIDYLQPRYREVDSAEAARLIENLRLPILDVRTPGEFKQGHLENAQLLPIQELQRRIGELESSRNEPLLIYCATGNRSTVAAKILIDNGFTTIYNLREGVHVWHRKGFPLVQ